MSGPRPVIAVDGRFLQRATYAQRGIGRVLRELLRRLPAAAPELRFVLVGAEEDPFDLRGAGGPGLQAATYPRPLLARRAPKVKIALLAEEPALRATLRRIGARALLVPTQHGAFPAAFPPRVLLFLDAIPYVFAEEEMRSPDLRAFYALTGQGARRARRVVAISESAARDGARLVGIRPDRLSVAHLGVDPSLGPSSPDAIRDARARLDLPARFLLHVGGFDPRKNVPALLRAFGRIAPRLPDLHMVLAGRVEEHQRGPLEREVASLGMEAAARVRLHGFVADADLPALLGASSALAFASRYEGFGLPVLEALACAAPVVAFDNSAIPEVAGEAALLVPDGDLDAFAEALLRVASEPAIADELRRRGPAQAARFTWESSARIVATALREAIGAGSEAVPASPLTSAPAGPPLAVRGADAAGNERTLRAPRPARISAARHPRPPRSILVVHPWAIGDWILFEPALRALRASFPGARIDAYLHQPGARAFVEALGGVSAIHARPQGGPLALARLLLALRRERYDLALATTSYRPWKAHAFLLAVGARRSVAEARGPLGALLLDGAARGTWGLHQVQANLAIARAAGALPLGDPSPRLVLSGEERAAGAAWLRARGVEPGRALILHPGGAARFAYKRWPLERFREVAKAARARGLSPLCVIGPDEADLLPAAREVAGAGPAPPGGERVLTGLVPRATAAVIAEAGAFLGSDSALCHLAAASGATTVVVIGPGRARRSAPVGERVRFVVRGGLSCQPCYPERPAGCAAMTCVRDLSIDPAVRALDALLAGA